MTTGAHLVVGCIGIATGSALLGLLAEIVGDTPDGIGEITAAGTADLVVVRIGCAYPSVAMGAFPRLTVMILLALFTIVQAGVSAVVIDALLALAYLIVGGVGSTVGGRWGMETNLPVDTTVVDGGELAVGTANLGVLSIGMTTCTLAVGAIDVAATSFAILQKIIYASSHDAHATCADAGVGALCTGGGDALTEDHICVVLGESLAASRTADSDSPAWIFSVVGTQT